MLDVARKPEKSASAPAVKDVLNFIAGEYVAAKSGKTFDKRSPVDGALIARVSEAGEAEVNAAVEAARAALQGPWGKITPAERGDLLYALANGINARFEDFLEAEVADTGKPMSLARHLDIPRGAANFKVFADTVKNVSTEFFEMATPDGTGAINYAMRRPIGVVGVICPWNLPLLLMTWKVAPAMACGNTVVVKPSEESPQTAALLGEVMNTVGIPKGVYNVVHGFGPGSAGEFLTRHPQRQRHHLHRRDPHRRRHHESRRRRRPAGVAGDGRQEPGGHLRRLRFRGRARRHHALVLRQLRPGVPGHRARLCRAAAVRQVRRRAQGAHREAQARPPAKTAPPPWAR